MSNIFRSEALVQLINTAHQQLFNDILTTELSLQYENALVALKNVQFLGFSKCPTKGVVRVSHAFIGRRHNFELAHQSYTL